VLDFAAPLSADQFTLSAERLAFIHSAPMPLQTYVIALSGRGAAYDDPAALLRGERVRPVDVRFLTPVAGQRDHSGGQPSSPWRGSRSLPPTAVAVRVGWSGTARPSDGKRARRHLGHQHSQLTIRTFPELLCSLRTGEGCRSSKRSWRSSCDCSSWPR
jgi:hypothetical protein